MQRTGEFRVSDNSGFFFEKMVTVKGIAYSSRDRHTDFSYMIRCNMYKDCLFLYNDNFEDRNRRHAGGGSAKIRPFAFDNPCRAIGISTGWSIQSGGFQILDENVKQAIWCCFEHINLTLMLNPNIRQVFFSCDSNDSDKLGFNLFSPCLCVANYINRKIHEIPKRLLKNIAISKQAIVLCEDMILRKRQGKDKSGWNALELQKVKRQKVRIQ
jgi:hypothetical protein